MGSITENKLGVDPSTTDASNIIDIRSDTAGIELRQEIIKGLKPEHGKAKTLPTLLLYDNEGLKLFERITYLDEYYLTGQEIQLLEKYAAQIADRIPHGANVIELGSGNLRKIRLLLQALEAAKKDVSYFALDLMQSELERTLAQVPHHTFKHVKCFGLHGTYDDGLAWMKRPENASQPKVVVSMGSSIGNFTRDDAAGFLQQFANILQDHDSLLVAVDACHDGDKIYTAYNDTQGVTHEFIRNGLRHANALLGSEEFKLSDWEVIGRYDAAGNKHHAFVTPKTNVTIAGVPIEEGEMVRIEESYKYTAPQSERLWQAAGVIEGARWSSPTGEYGLHMLKKPAVMYPTAPERYAAHPVPDVEEWESLWKAWDIVTRQMIPDDELMSKPIKLRNACIFYLGHIPTFLDMKIAQATQSALTEPKYFSQIFERGIDPDVDNPEHCHAHSEIPDEWPPLDEMLAYQERIRKRVIDLYNSGAAYENLWTGRVLWLGFEHEVMHLETLLYMLLQSDKTLPPAGTVKPDFEQLAMRATKAAVDNQWFDVPEQSIDIGLEDPDNGNGPLRHFGWDVEKPKMTVQVKAIKAKARPITNGEYARYLSDTKDSGLPVSWMEVPSEHETNGALNGEAKLQHFLQSKAVRTVYGPVLLKYALDWPVSASYDELAGCAAYMGGRIPTMEEARSIYAYADTLNKLEASQTLGKTIPAVNGHLINEGVQESPPSKSFVNGAHGATTIPDPNEFFVNLDAANVGFKQWHPMPVTQNGGRLSGQGEMGGLWEWTSSTLQKREGFEPMQLYPAYSDDFYDGKHNIVLGGSWATHPRVAGRKTFVNWYQRAYPYVWAGARLVRDE